MTQRRVTAYCGHCPLPPRVYTQSLIATSREDEAGAGRQQCQRLLLPRTEANEVQSHRCCRSQRHLCAIIWSNRSNLSPLKFILVQDFFWRRAQRGYSYGNKEQVLSDKIREQTGSGEGRWVRGTAVPHAPDNSSGAGATPPCAKQNPSPLLQPVLGPRALLNLEISIQPRETNPDNAPPFQYSVNTGKR